MTVTSVRSMGTHVTDFNRARDLSFDHPAHSYLYHQAGNGSEGLLLTPVETKEISQESSLINTPTVFHTPYQPRPDDWIVCHPGELRATSSDYRGVETLWTVSRHSRKSKTALTFPARKEIERPLPTSPRGFCLSCSTQYSKRRRHQLWRKLVFSQRCKWHAAIKAPGENSSAVDPGPFL